MPAAPLPIDASVDRVIRGYQIAMQADPTSPTPVEEIIRFGRRVGRLDAAEAGFKEMVRRKKEKETAEPLARYGDFLAEEKKDPLAAIEQYRESLIWVPDNDAVRGKVAAIYLKMAAEAFAKQQYKVTEDYLRDASKYVTDRAIRAGPDARGLPGPPAQHPALSPSPERRASLRTGVRPWPFWSM